MTSRAQFRLIVLLTGIGGGLPSAQIPAFFSATISPECERAAVSIVRSVALPVVRPEAGLPPLPPATDALRRAQEFRDACEALILALDSGASLEVISPCVVAIYPELAADLFRLRPLQGAGGMNLVRLSRERYRLRCAIEEAVLTDYEAAMLIGAEHSVESLPDIRVR